MSEVWGAVHRHRFFHWALEFPEVFAQGGFDVVLANPPYDVVKENRYLRYSDMKGTGNLFAHFLSRATDILAQNGGMGFVVPLSLACGETFESTRRKLYRNFGAIYASHYSIRPTQLFPGVEQRVSLLKCTDHGVQPCQLYSTRLHRWHKGDEDKVVAGAQYGAVGTLSEGVIPKVAGEFGAVIYDKIRNQPCHVAEWLAREPTVAVTVYFHTVARYWIKAYDFVPFFEREGLGEGTSTTLKTVVLPDRTSALRFLCLFNSSLFYYWWLSQSDEFHVLESEVSGFGVPDANALWPSDELLAKMVKELMDSYKANAVRKQLRVRGGGTVYYDEFRPRYSLKEIYAIDDMLAKVYGLTPEENEFLKTYDLEFRTDEE